MLGALALLFTAAMIDGCASMGAAAEGARLQRMRSSKHWDKGVFFNAIPEQPIPKGSALWAWIKGAPNTSPKDPPQVSRRTSADFATAPGSGLRITWLGHSSALIEIDGHRVLTDPIWSKRAGPFSFAGPKRFHEVPLPLAELPRLDAVIISHDHYDHLDRDTVIALNKRKLPFVVPLGVGAHLEKWGVPAGRITELDWWGHTKVGDLILVATPARHFSGRSLTMSDRNKTLWAGWALVGPNHRVFFSGDTAMFPGFKEIARRLGPFDATMIEVGAYNAMWADVHLGPEQAVAAHRMLGGKLMLPIHWGTFDLALHAWTEPAERIVVAAGKHGVHVAIPRPGQRIEPARAPKVTRWWPELPWKRAEDAPVRSSGLKTPAPLARGAE